MTQVHSIEQLAARAGVEGTYVRHLIEVGALGHRGHAFSERDAHLVAVFHMWETAGLPAESILAAVRAGQLSLDFLETPAWSLPERVGPTYREFAEQQGVPLHLLLDVHRAMGFVPPDPDERTGTDDPVLAALIRIVLEIGASESTVLRLFRLYADNLRRLATAEVDLYAAEVERLWKESGADEPELMRQGSATGRRMMEPVEAALIVIYNRHRQHVWSDVAIGRAEAVLERAGLRRPVTRTPAICFVDLTGYTRLTEEVGDRAAARLAASLADLVDEISRRHGGRPIRWLGDGGCSTSGTRRPPSWRRWRWSRARPLPACHPPTSGSSPGRWSSKTATSMAGR